jgi:hypothetical protein
MHKERRKRERENTDNFMCTRLSKKCTYKCFDSMTQVKDILNKVQ